MLRSCRWVLCALVCTAASTTRVCPKSTRDRDSVLVVTRSMLEQAYLNGFVAWYTKLGVECFLLFRDDPATTALALPPLPDSVKVFQSKSKIGGNHLLKDFLEPVKRSEYTWALAVDTDEYLLLAPHFRSLAHYIADIGGTHPMAIIDAFQFPWARVEMLQPLCSQSRVCRALQEPNLVYHSNKHVKTLSRISQVVGFSNAHSPSVMVQKEACTSSHEQRPCARWQVKRSVYSAGMLLQTTPCSSCSNASKRLWLSPFSPPDVAVGRKYADSAMVHVQTRSLANMLTKAAATRLENGKGEVVKGMANASALARLAQQASQYQERPALLASFKEAVGVKAALAFMVDLPLNLSHLIHAARPPDDDPAMCDAEREQSIFNDVFTAQGFAPRGLWKLLQDVSAELLPLHQ